jgi:hypothetical protein
MIVMLLHAAARLWPFPGFRPVRGATARLALGWHRGLEEQLKGYPYG